MAKYEPEYIPDNVEDIEDAVYILVDGKMVAVDIPDDDSEPVDEED